MSARWVMAFFALAACRTEIRPAVKRDPTERARMVDGQCQVRDYPSATEVPAHTKNLGWVKVRRQETDEATFEKLREEVCKRGGENLSQIRWVRASGASVGEPPVELEGNAWSAPSSEVP